MLRVCSSVLPRILHGAWLLLAAAAAAQVPGDRVHVEIPAQSLSGALMQFGRETGTEVGFTPDTVRAKEAQGIAGDFEPAEAIKMLLRGTGLSYRTTAEGAFVVENSPPVRVARASVHEATLLASANTQPLDTLTVEARRQHEALVKQVNTFVKAITPRTFDEALIDWRSAICPMVAGLPRDRGEYILTRVSKVALDAGAPIAASPKCHPNFIVVATDDPDLLLRKWRERDPRMFTYHYGIAGVKRFLSSDEPVRVWYNAAEACPGGLGFIGMNPNSPSLGFWPVCSHLGHTGSRLTFQRVPVINSVIVVVDLGKTTDLNIGQLADYVTMIGLVQVRKVGDPGTAPTIMRLFDANDAARPASMSNWDQAFLKALYHTAGNSVTQLSEIETKTVQYIAEE